MRLSQIDISTILKNSITLTVCKSDEWPEEGASFDVDLESFPNLEWFEICITTDAAGVVQIQLSWMYKSVDNEESTIYQLDVLNRDTPAIITEKLKGLFDLLRKGTLISNLDD